MNIRSKYSSKIFVFAVFILAVAGLLVDDRKGKTKSEINRKLIRKKFKRKKVIDFVGDQDLLSCRNDLSYLEKVNYMKVHLR